MYHHVKRATRHLIFWSLVIAALILTLIRLWLTGVENYKTSLETRIGAQIGTPVKLGGLGAKMRGITPELVLKKITVASKLTTEKPALSLEEIRLGINLGELLYTHDLLASARISLIGANLSVYRNADGKFVLEGLRTGEGEPLWLLQGRQYLLLHSRVIWQDRQQGGSPIQLDDVNLAIINDGDNHRINILAQLPERFGKELKLILDIQGSPEKLSELKGNLYLEGNTVNLQESVDNYLPFNNHVIGGLTDFKIWGELKNSQIVSLISDIQIADAAFIHPGNENLNVNRLDARMRWRQHETGWQMDCYRFALETAGKSKNQTTKWPDAIFSLAGAIQPKPAYRAYVKEIDLAEVRKLLEFFAPLPEKLAQLLRESQIEGFLHDFYYYVEPGNGSFAIAGQFDALNTAPFQNFPGLKHLKGRIQGSDTRGILELDGLNVLFNRDTIFDKTLKFDKLAGLISWKQNDKQWEIESPSILLDSQSLKSESRLHIVFPKTELNPFIDLQTGFTIGDVRQIRHYLPLPVMTTRLSNWLSNAFEKGEVSRGDMLWYGNLDNFPYLAGDGVFQVLLALNNINLHYHPDWLNINGIDGNLSIHKNKIDGLFKKGVIGKAEVSKTEMTISDLDSNPVIAIKGEAQGEITEVLTILQQSPLKERITPIVSNTKISGNTKGTLSLTIPLQGEQDIDISGAAKLTNAKLGLNKPALDITNITGELKFNGQGVSAESVKAVVLNKPVTADISQQNNATIITANGRANSSDVLKLFEWYDPEVSQGESEYQLQLDLLNDTTGDKPIILKVESDLEGIAINIPGALSKSSAQKKPSELTLSIASDSFMPISLNYNNELKAAIKLNTIDRKVASGNILIGAGHIGFKNGAGVRLEINKDQLPLQDWLALAANRKQVLDSWLPIDELRLHSNTAYWQKTRIGAFDLKIKNSQNVWSGDINSIYAKGNFEFPEPLNAIAPIDLNMEMLNLSALKQLNLDGSASSGPDFKPLLKIHSNKTLWRSVNLGVLDMETARVAKGLTIKRFNLEGADEKLTMTGDWVDNPMGTSTQVKGVLDLKKADQFFNKLNITKDFTETKGRVDFKLNWNRAPWRLTLPDLRGAMDINLKNGRILSIEPGFGRVLGILAVAQWIKRLQLDFSDIFEEGLTFNSIKGHFDFLNGNALTQDLTIDAVPAMITITGDTNLIKQTVDHRIKVVPKSYDAVPIAGTIVGKVADLIGKSITGKDQTGFFFGREYWVKGQWDKVNIKPLHEKDGLLQKTWNSITDFPWIEPTEQDNGITQ